MKKALICLSGGMDSTTSLYYIKDKFKCDIQCVSFFYNQKHKREIEMAKYHCEKMNIAHDIIDITFLNTITKNVSSLTGDIDVPKGMYDQDNMKSTVVPFRNGIMLSILASYADSNNCDTIIYGAHTGDHAQYPDCTLTFNRSMEKAIYFGTHNKIELVAPFMEINKNDICKIGLSLGVDYSKTWTCYNGKEKPCGKCGSCVERNEAFLTNNSKDPLYTDEDWEHAVNFYNEVSR